MILTPHGPRRHRLAALCVLLWGSASAQASEGIPALLEFAEQYTSQAPAELRPGMAQKPATPTTTANPRPATLDGDRTRLRQTLSQREAQLARQQLTLREQAKQLAALRQSLAAAERQRAQAREPAPQATPADFAPLQQLVSQLRDAARGTPDAKRSAALIAQARELAAQRQRALADSQAQVQALTAQQAALQKQLARCGQDISQAQQSHQALQTRLETLQEQREEGIKALQAGRQQLEDAQVQHAALTQQLTALQQKQAAAQAEQQNALAGLKAQLATREEAQQTQQAALEQKEAALAALQTEKRALTQQHETLQHQLEDAGQQRAEQAAALTRLQDEVKGLRERDSWLATPETLNAPATRQAYAAGTALGRDIVSLLEDYRHWGVNVDRRLVLAGVMDTFSGQYQLPPEALRTALTDSETAVNRAREQATRQQQQKDRAFVDKFKKQKGVQQSPSGFWYRVDHAGDAPIADGAVINVVVKESLTDGTVVQDMDLNDKVISQQLDAYPPLFREALGYLRNHGELTLVVPPALAYGDAGYPPKVPPNATLVYTLRVETATTAPGTAESAGTAVLGAAPAGR